MLMMFALRSREAVRKVATSSSSTATSSRRRSDVLLTRSEPFGIELIVDEYDEYSFTGKEFGAIVQYPAANGAVRDYTDFTAAAHAKGVLVTAAADLLSLALLKSPGEWGADIAVGSTQRLGTPMGFGGPGAGYMATREAYKRNMPGRIIGVSVDRLGNKALRMALQMREQHIKRERATSNICTASALMASMAGFYCVYNGPEGLKRAADTAHPPPQRSPTHSVQWITNPPPQTSSTRSKSRPKPPSCSRWHSKAASTSTTPHRRLRAHVVRRGDPPKRLPR